MIGKQNLGNVLSLVAFAVLFMLCLTFVGIRALGLGTFIVTGGSMEPSIHKGSLVLVQPASPSEVQVGDVITFQQYDQTTTHRVVTIAQSEKGLSFKTKGDANTVADPEDKTFAGSVGIVRVAVPLAGYATASMQAYWRLLLTVLAALIFFFCAGALVLRKDATVAPVRAPIVIRRPVVLTVDPDEAWNAHVEWLRRTHRNTMVA